MYKMYTLKSELLFDVFGFVRFYIAPIQYRSYVDFPANRWRQTSRAPLSIFQAQMGTRVKPPKNTRIALKYI
jgi:hypothetical protein